MNVGKHAYIYVYKYVGGMYAVCMYAPHSKYE